MGFIVFNLDLLHKLHKNRWNVKNFFYINVIMLLNKRPHLFVEELVVKLLVVVTDDVVFVNVFDEVKIICHALGDACL